MVNEAINDFSDELSGIEEYERGYPNSDFDVSGMTAYDLAEWCRTVGDFLYIYNGFRGWRVSGANTSAIVSEIVNDLHHCSYIEPTHEMDHYFYNEKEFENSYVCIFKVVGAEGGDFYIIYQQDKI